MWLGKIIGAATGFFRGGLFGSFIGLVAGHLIDELVNKKITGKGLGSAQARELFFRATFRFMGRLAKADGRVSEHEISVAEQVMAQMGLHGEQRNQAIRFFTEGKSPSGDLDTDLRQLRKVFAQNPDLSQAFFEIQLSVAYADGKLSVQESKLFDETCQILGVNKLQFKILQRRVWAAMQSQRGQRGQSIQAELRNAYAVLGVNEDVSDTDLKKAYRRLMSQHHPDKLISKGLPEEMMTLAKEKTQQIQSAYDQVSKSRK